MPTTSRRYEKACLTPVDSVQTSQVLQVLHNPKVEILHVIARVGEDIPAHEPQGIAILHCLSGHIEVSGPSRELAVVTEGEILLLPANEPFLIKPCELSSLLVLILEPQTGGAVSLIGT